MTRGGLRCLATQQSNRLVLHTAAGPMSFWAGVNLGGTTPGHSPGELAISPQDYQRWFTQMGEMGIRFLRIYTIHPPHMYQTLRTYNETHRQDPLYLIHGVYLPDESYVKSADLYDRGPTEAMTREVRDASAATHGRLTRARMRGRAWGTWDADVSPWLAAWIVGVEWDPVATAASDRRNARAPAVAGRFFASAPRATPTERWLVARLDELATAEARSGVSLPIAAVNWPTADPLRHPQEHNSLEDLVTVDANHIVPQPAWPGGTFASYHAYPYYPDFQLLQPGYQVGGDSYRAYLADLKRHHAGMPMMVTEFGVPSSLGMAHRGSARRDQGFHSEQEKLSMDAGMLRSIRDLDLAGALVFVWADEWFKFTWNTRPRQAPVSSERRALWHDPLTNEQFFGIIATDPIRVGERAVVENRTGIQRIGLDHDASWVYLNITFENEPMQRIEVGFDVIPGGGLSLPGVGDEATSRAPDYDVRVSIDPGHRTATALIRPDLDPITLDGLSGPLPGPEPDGWLLQRLALNRAYTMPGTKRRVAADFFEVGRLLEGRWEPGETGSDSRSTWQLTGPQDGFGALLRLRLPWSMLSMADPSSRVALAPRAGVATGVPVSQIGVRVEAGAAGSAAFPLRWEGWNRVAYTERLKEGAQPLLDALLQYGR
ncbi:MAG TPA: hypothetical protein VES01_05820 [Dermatophilaceae bacterium]|nr:hypothetical protein [Dermatophilaceae bacterium]